MGDDLVLGLANWLAIGERHGLLEPTRVHFGSGRESYPSKRNVTLTPELAAAYQAARSSSVHEAPAGRQAPDG